MNNNQLLRQTDRKEDAIECHLQSLNASTNPTRVPRMSQVADAIQQKLGLLSAISTNDGNTMMSIDRQRMLRQNKRDLRLARRTSSAALGKAQEDAAIAVHHQMIRDGLTFLIPQPDRLEVVILVDTRDPAREEDRVNLASTLALDDLLPSSRVVPAGQVELGHLFEAEVDDTIGNTRELTHFTEHML